MKIKPKPKQIPVRIIGIASHMKKFDRLRSYLGLNSIPFPCKGRITGETCDLGYPMVRISGTGQTFSLYWFEYSD
jgi:hypothetical protein